MKLIQTLHTENAKRRYNVCVKCDRFDINAHKCLECGCFMPVKVMMPTAQCPKQLW
jgi:hypothetical protein